MKIFSAVLLASLFAATAAQAEPEADANAACPFPFTDLDIKILKAVDSNIEDKDYWKLAATLQVRGDASVEDLIERDLSLTLLSSDPHPVELDSIDFLSENCKLRTSGKSAVCKEDWSRLTITEIKAPKNTFEETAGETYTYFKISAVVRNADFSAELSEKLSVDIDDVAAGSCYERQSMDCDLKEFAKKSRVQAICKENIDAIY